MRRVRLKSRPIAPIRYWMTSQSCVREKRSRPGTERTRPAAVLVVDDDEQFRALARGLLEPAGFAITEAASIGACLERLRSQAPDALVLDIILPGRDGIAALGEIKALFPRIKIVTVSGAVESELYLAVSADMGADASLSKSSVTSLGALLRVVLGH
jgi:CheY-like chemotaxis protein